MRTWEGQKIYEQIHDVPILSQEMRRIRIQLKNTGKADPSYRTYEESLLEVNKERAYKMNYVLDCLLAAKKYNLLTRCEMEMFKMRYRDGMTIQQIADRKLVTNVRYLKRKLGNEIPNKLGAVMYREGWMPWAGEKGAETDGKADGDRTTD